MKNYPTDVLDYMQDKIETFISDEEEIHFESARDFVSRLLDEDIANGSITCEAESARKWVAENVGNLGDWFQMQKESGTLQNPFMEPERFQLQVFIDCFTDIICNAIGNGSISTKGEIEAILEDVHLLQKTGKEKGAKTFTLSVELVDARGFIDVEAKSFKEAIRKVKNEDYDPSINPDEIEWQGSRPVVLESSDGELFDDF